MQDKPDPNICSKFYRLFLPASPKKFTYYFYPHIIIPYYSLCFVALGIDIQKNMNSIHS